MLDTAISPLVLFMRYSVELGTRTRSSITRASVLVVRLYVADERIGGVVSEYTMVAEMFWMFGNITPVELNIPPGMIVNIRGGIIAIKSGLATAPH